MAVGYVLDDYFCVLDKSLSGLIYLMGGGAGLSATAADGVGCELIDSVLVIDGLLAGKK